jgi:MoxR-like ATPase
VKVPEAGEALGAQVVSFVQMLRGLELFKPPGIAETIDWAQALMTLNARELTAGNVDETLGVVLKYQDDIARVRGDVAAQGVAAARTAA